MAIGVVRHDFTAISKLTDDVLFTIETTPLSDISPTATSCSCRTPMGQFM
jgi:hypothetical protein